MASVALTLRVLADTSQAAAEMRRLGDETSSFADRAGKVAAVAAGFAAVGAGIMKAAQSASALEQAAGGVEAVFKSGAGQVKKWADDAARSIGLSKSQYMDLATLIGSQLKNAGVSMDELGGSTDQLIKQGADLAAMFGGTTAEAVESISAALKGERDPIEKYGITLTEAAVQAEILAMGLDTSTSAAEQNAKAMATMSLITKQGADAWGAAAREADSFAAQQQVMQAVFENTMAELGQIFLPMLADLAGAFADIAPTIQTLLTPLSELLAAVLSLPTPILGVAAAIGLWAAFGGPITAGLKSFGSAISGAMGSTAAFKSTLMSVAKTAAGGLALAAVTLALTQFLNSLDDGEESVKSFQDSVSGLSEAMLEAGSADWSGEMQSMWEQTARTSDSFAALTQRGIDAATAMQYLTDTGFQPTQQQADALAAAVSDMDVDLSMTTAHFREQAAAAQENAAELLAKKQADEAAAASAAAAGTATAAQTQLLQEQAQANAQAAAEAAKVAAEQTAVATAMRDAEAATQAAARAADAFGLAMDQLAGRNLTAEQAAYALNSAMASTTDAFAKSAEAGGYSMDALVNWKVEALTTTEAGRQLYGSLNDVRAGYDQSVAAAYQQGAANGDAAAGMAAARTAADTAYSSFITMATGAGLSADQAAALAAKLGIVAGTAIPDKTFELIAQDQQAQAAVTTAQQAEIDSKTFDVNAIIAPAQGQFNLLTGERLANTVQVDAATGQAQNQLQSVAGAKYPATVTTTADTNQAQSTLQGFTSAQRATQITVQANTMPAQEAITALTTQRRTLEITVTANTQPAQSAINSIQGRTVDVTVRQNTIQTVTQAPAPALAAAPAMAVSAAAAPPDLPYTMHLTAESAPPPMRRLRADTSDTTDTDGATYQITINGAVDAEAVGRQLDSILTRYARRRGGVRVGWSPDWASTR